MPEIDNSQSINTNSPRDSRVFADGKYVIKKPVDTNSSHIKVWLERQKHAKDVVDNIKVGNYFIPKIVEISEDLTKPFVREERVYGKPVTVEYFNTLSQNQKDIIYNSLAQFISNMNQSYPVRDIISQFGNYLSFLNSLKSVLTDKEIVTIKNAYELLERNPEKLPSLVFFHGDMNENNIFFDEKTDTVSIIDFTESRYVSDYYMFYSDLSKLPWLDLDKLMTIYNELPKKTQVRLNQDKNMMDVFNNLRTVQNTADSLLKHPKNVEIYKRILKEAIVFLEKAYSNVVNSFNIIAMSAKVRQ